MKEREYKFADSFQFLRNHFGNRIDKDQVSWREVETALRQYDKRNEIFFILVCTKAKNEIRVRNHTHQREEAQNDGRHTGAKRGVDSESERDRRKAEISAKLNDERRSLAKLDEDIRRLEGELTQRKLDRKTVSSRITLLEKEIRDLQQGVDRYKGGAIDLTKGDSDSPMLPAPEFRDVLADAAEGRRQSGAARGTQSGSRHAGHDQSSVFGANGSDSRVVTCNGSSKLAGITNHCGAWANNICWLSSGVKFLIAGLDLDDSTQVKRGDDVEALKTVKRLLIRNAYPKTVRGNCPELHVFFGVLQYLNIELAVGKFNDCADFIRVFLDKYTVPKLAQCSTGISTITKAVTSELRDLTCFAHLMLDDQTDSGPVSLADAFEQTSNVASRPNKSNDVIQTFVQLVIEPDIKSLFVQVTRGYVGVKDHTAAGRVSLKEHIEIQGIKFRLLGFVYRPNPAHYTAVLRDGDIFFDHNDALVTQVGSDLGKYEGGATFLAYERV